VNLVQTKRFLGKCNFSQENRPCGKMQPQPIFQNFLFKKFPCVKMQTGHKCENDMFSKKKKLWEDAHRTKGFLIVFFCGFHEFQIFAKRIPNYLNILFF